MAHCYCCFVVRLTSFGFREGSKEKAKEKRDKAKKKEREGHKTKKAGYDEKVALATLVSFA